MSITGTRILASGIQMLVQTGMSLGLDRERLLEAAALTEQELADHDAQLPFEKQLALGESIAAARPGVNIGMVALRNVSPAMFGIVGYVVSNCTDLRESLGMFIRFQQLLTDALRWKLVEGTSATLVVDADPRYSRIGFPVEALLGVWLRLGTMLTGAPCAPLRVELQHAPVGDPAELEAVFGTTVRFGAPRNALEMPRSTLDRPLKVGNLALAPSLRKLSEEQLSVVTGHGSFAAELRAAMFEHVPKGVTTKPALAKQLGMSTRTLSRRLHAEGITFRQLLDETRRELALAWLRDPEHSVYDVAFLLGYSEPSTFHRSFRRWTGCSPRVWRTQQAAPT